MIPHIPLVTLCAFMVFPTLAFSFSLVEPKNSSRYFSGEKASVHLNIGEVAGLTAVHYFLYGDDEDMLEELVEQKLVLISTSTASPPFGGMIRMPRTAIGTYRLLAVAQLEAGQVDTEKWAVFDEILIKIDPKAQLNEIDFECEKPLRFGSAASARVYDQVDFLGKTFDLPIIGRFSDGTVRSIRRKDTGTVYAINDERVVAINENGLLRLVGNGTATLTAKNGDQEAVLEIHVKVRAQSNQPPVAQPGQPQTVYSSDRVTLDGLASFDSDGGSLQYRWSQVRGSKISLLDPYSGTPKFLAPFVPKQRLFRFKLQVTDTQGADSNPAYVDVLVMP